MPKHVVRPGRPVCALVGKAAPSWRAAARTDKRTAPSPQAASTSSVDLLSPAPEPAPQPQRYTSPLRRLAPRLFTHQDTAHLHAISASAFLLLSSWEVLRILYLMVSAGEVPMPDHPAVIPMLVVSGVLKDATGFIMASKHRKGVVRTAFLGASIMSSAMILSLWFYSSSFPIDNEWAVLAMRAVLLGMVPLAVAWPLVDFLINLGPLLETRLERPRASAAWAQEQQGSGPQLEEEEAAASDADGAGHAAVTPPQQPSESLAATGISRLLELFTYVLPGLVPAYLSVFALTIAALSGVPSWHLFHENYPHFEALTFSWAQVGLWAGSVGVFGTSLRDRRLIGRSLEMTMFGVPFAIFATYVAASCGVHEDALALFLDTSDPSFLVTFIQQAWQQS